MVLMLWRVDMLERTTDGRHPDEESDTYVIESGFQSLTSSKKYNGILNV